MRRKLTEEEITEKKQRILETAHDLLMKEDYRKITIRQITAACGMATGTFFNYFPSKENLFLHLLYEKNSQYYLHEIDRIRKAAPTTFDDYVRFLMDGARDTVENHEDLITFFINYYEILSSASVEHVPEEPNKKYLTTLNQLVTVIHEMLPFITPDEALRNYSFFHAQLIGAKHLAPISALGSYSPALLDAKAEVLLAYKRYLEGARIELGM